MYVDLFDDKTILPCVGLISIISHLHSIQIKTILQLCFLVLNIALNIPHMF